MLKIIVAGAEIHHIVYWASNDLTIGRYRHWKCRSANPVKHRTFTPCCRKDCMSAIIVVKQIKNRDILMGIPPSRYDQNKQILIGQQCIAEAEASKSSWGNGRWQSQQTGDASQILNFHIPRDTRWNPVSHPSFRLLSESMSKTGRK